MACDSPAPLREAGVSELLRLYESSELGRDGYPLAWHLGPGEFPAIKDYVRELAEHRCVRCQHPYRNGEHGTGEWTPCDERCEHEGPLRVVEDRDPDTLEAVRWQRLNPELNAGVMAAKWAFPVEARWRILTVHHLTGEKADCRWWNLVAVCQRDHLYLQGRVQMDQIWPWEHSEWFRPYAAGFYAWKYLGEDINRNEADERMEELLGLERVA